MNISSYIHFPQAKISLSEHEDIPAQTQRYPRPSTEISLSGSKHTTFYCIDLPKI